VGEGIRGEEFLDGMNGINDRKRDGFLTGRHEIMKYMKKAAGVL
jgi:hypothetical protein